MKTIYKLLVIPAAFMLLQSCFVAKDYESPQVDQEEYYRTDNIPQDSLTLARVSWKNLFTDHFLQDHIESALSNNIDIRIALQQIAVAHAYVKQGKAGYYPQLSADGQYTLAYPSKNGQQGRTLEQTGKDHINNYEIGGSLSWEADIWGKIRSQKRAFDASYLQTVAAHQAVKTQLISNIASAYYQLLALDEQIKVTESTVETRKESWETTKSLKDAGLPQITSTAVQQTEAQYLDAQGLLLDLKKEMRLLENVISLLKGDEPHSIERSSLDEQEITTELKTGVPSQLLRNRPDVIAAENGYRRAFEMTNSANASLYPSLSIGASGGLESLSLSNWFETNSLFGNIFGGITAPIFNGRVLRTDYEVAKIEQEQALLDFKGALLRASKEVSDAMYDYETATEKIELKVEQEKLLQRAVEDSQELLNSGYNNFSYLEVLSAQENALGSSLDVINARTDQLTSIVDLYEALGGGWE